MAAADVEYLQIGRQDREQSDSSFVIVEVDALVNDEAEDNP